MDGVNVNTSTLLPLLWASKLSATTRATTAGTATLSGQPFQWPVSEFPNAPFKLLANNSEQHIQNQNQNANTNSVLNGKLSLFSAETNDENNKFSYLQRITSSATSSGKHLSLTLFITGLRFRLNSHFPFWFSHLLHSIAISSNALFLWLHSTLIGC